MARDEAYQEAERRIEEARRNGSTSLDLSGMGLTEVPEAIAKLSQFKTLYLQDNQNSVFILSIAKQTKASPNSEQLLLKKKDPSFGGLVRVQNKRCEVLWVHEKFVSEY